MDGVLLLSTIVEILLYYLTKIYLIDEIYIYNSRNSFILLNAFPIPIKIIDLQ